MEDNTKLGDNRITRMDNFQLEIMMILALLIMIIVIIIIIMQYK